MVRLLAVKASIIALKRALSLSDRLKPATWELLAIFCAALFVLSALGFVKSEQPRSQPVVTSLTPRSITPQVGGGSSISPQIARYAWEVTPATRQTFSGQVTGTNFVAGTHVLIFQAKDYTAVYTHVGERLDTAHAHLHVMKDVSGSAPAPMVKPLLFALSLEDRALASAVVSAEDAHFTRQWGAIDIPSLLRSLRQVPTVIYQPAPEEGTSFKKELMSWAPLLGLLLSPLTGLGMMLLALLGHHRKRGEDILLQLQIDKITLENDNLTLVNRNLALTNEKLEIEVRALRQEAGRSRIISG